MCQVVDITGNLTQFGECFAGFFCLSDPEENVDLVCQGNDLVLGGVNSFFCQALCSLMIFNTQVEPGESILSDAFHLIKEDFGGFACADQ